MLRHFPPPEIGYVLAEELDDTWHIDLAYAIDWSATSVPKSEALADVDDTQSAELQRAWSPQQLATRGADHQFQDVSALRPVAARALLDQHAEFVKRVSQGIGDAHDRFP
jgi:hypothetical protein